MQRHLYKCYSLRLIALTRSLTDVLFARLTAASYRLCGAYKFEDLLQVKSYTIDKQRSDYNDKVQVFSIDKIRVLSTVLKLQSGYNFSFVS